MKGYNMLDKRTMAERDADTQAMAEKYEPLLQLEAAIKLLTPLQEALKDAFIGMDSSPQHLGMAREMARKAVLEWKEQYQHVREFQGPEYDLTIEMDKSDWLGNLPRTTVNLIRAHDILTIVPSEAVCALHEGRANVTLFRRIERTFSRPPSQARTGRTPHHSP